MPDPSKEQEFREETEQLAKASREDQRAIIALHRSVADNPKVRKADRQAARERADTLERLLGLKPQKKQKK